MKGSSSLNEYAFNTSGMDLVAMCDGSDPKPCEGAPLIKCLPYMATDGW